jgi:hypothetical protein
MTQADSVLSTPPTNTSANNVKSQEKALARQEAQRWRALKRLRKLRAKAADEIDRLLDFLDASDIDPDLEPTLGFMNGPPEMDECETPVDDEPSLGFLESHPTNWNDGRDRSGNQDRICAGLGGDLEDEHDGAEPDVDGEPSIGYDAEPAEQDTGNDEPSLGWTDEEAARGRTYAGCYGNNADREEGEPARKPQNRTSIDREPITVDVTYRRFIRGLTPEQRKRVKAARQRGVGPDVIIA